MATAKESLRERVCKTVRRSIGTGELAPGDRVSPTVLARQIGTSHIPVREALSQLVSERVLEHRRGEGVFVHAPDIRQTIELYEARRLLESATAAHAARKATDAQLALLREQVQIMRAVADRVTATRARAFDLPMLVEFAGADLLFHRQLARSMGNRYVLRMLSGTWFMMRVHSVAIAPSSNFPELAQRSYRAHQDIYDAVAARDARTAGRRMSQHVRITGRSQVRRMLSGTALTQVAYPPALIDLLERLEREDQELSD